MIRKQILILILVTKPKLYHQKKPITRLQKKREGVQKVGVNGGGGGEGR